MYPKGSKGKFVDRIQLNGDLGITGYTLSEDLMIFTASLGSKIILNPEHAEI